MSRVKAKALVALFKRMARENWRYEWGKAKEGVVDCSGAFVYAMDKLGALTLPHGSNAIVRQWAGEIAPIAQAKPGYLVTKWRADFTGANAEELMRKYGSDGLGNHYHIGLMGDDGKVYNAQSEATGFVASDPKGWKYCFVIQKVDYDEEEESMATLYRATVCTESDPLNVRDAPKTGRKIGVVPRGGTVEVLSEGEWPRIRFGELVGYASAAFLSRAEEEAPETDGEEAAAESGTVEVSRAAMLALADAVAGMEGMSSFTSLAASVAKMQEAAEAVCAYMRGDD